MALRSSHDLRFTRIEGDPASGARTEVPGDCLSNHTANGTKGVVVHFYTY